ncbi:MAG TPA: AAA family ATPase [Nocardioides sp.]|nr:AAA family ATPase [Nocardioides sp.]
MGARGSLVGRDRETAALTAFLDEQVPGGLVVTGEPGFGKSALWEHAADLATERGAVVLRATPGEGEERHSFGVLHDLFRDTDLDGHRLRGPVHEALAVVLLREAVTGPIDAQLVGAGVHDLLADLAADHQVVVGVDDAHWADPGSLQALTFAARRLDRAPVQFLLTRRTGYGRTTLEASLARRGLRQVEPRPLSAEETARLLRRDLDLTLSSRVLRQVHEQSRGNPLFVLEIGRALLERGIPEAGKPLGLPAEMADVLGLRVRDLPDDQRTVLLAVALDGQLNSTDLVALAGLESVERAGRRHLITMTEDGRTRPWHPLLAAAARETATPVGRQDLHRRLAEVVSSPEQRVRHLALASADPDEELAIALSESARLAGDRGATDTALELAALALARTPDGSPARTGRVLDLAGRLAVVNEAQRLTDFLEPEIERIPPGPERGQALLMLLDGRWGTVAHAQHLVDRALAESGDDPEVRGRALGARSHIAGGVSVWNAAACLAWAEEAIELGFREDSEWWMASRARSWCLVRGGRPPEPAEGDPMWKRLIWRGELAEAEHGVRQQMAAAEEAGRFRESESLWEQLFDVLERSGRVREARQYLDGLLDIDLPPDDVHALEVMRAVVAVRYGDVLTARELASSARGQAEAFGDVWNRLEADHVLAMAALQSGEPEAAEELLRGVFDHVVTAGLLEPGTFPVAPDLVEALALQGRYDEAGEIIAWLEELSEEQDHPWGRAMSERSRVLVGLLDESFPPPVASSRTAAVADELTALGLLHDAARAHLAIGSALRRQRQWGLARDHLSNAEARFEELGADGWAATVRGELGRVGGRRPAADGALTPTELEVARLASEGLPNKTIARQLKVSVSTVETHLTRAYAKLGVRSRARLGARLQELSAGLPHG